jgi:hypothetical protein
MPPEHGKKLFHAIVVVGASLAGCRDDSSDDSEPRLDAASAADAASEGGAAGTLDASSTPDASRALDGGQDAASAPDASPPTDAGRDAAGDGATTLGAADAARDAEEDVSFPHIIQ